MMQYELSILEPETQIANRLSKYFKETPLVRLTKNKRTFLSFRTNRNGVSLRLHNCFAGAPEEVVAALCALIKNRDKISRKIICGYFSEQTRNLKSPKKSNRRIISNGEIFNLGDILSELNALYFDNRITSKITWGRARRGSKKWFVRSRNMTLGQYLRSDNLIVIHPSLDRPKVPKFVVESIVHHEMCHEAVQGDVKNGRRRVHTKEFHDMERAFSFYEDSKKWCKENIKYLLKV